MANANELVYPTDVLNHNGSAYQRVGGIDQLTHVALAIYLARMTQGIKHPDPGNCWDDAKEFLDAKPKEMNHR